MFNLFTIITLLLNTLQLHEIISDINKLPFNPFLHTQKLNVLQATYNSLCQKESFTNTNDLKNKLQILLNNIHEFHNKLIYERTEFEKINYFLYIMFFETIHYATSKSLWELHETCSNNSLDARMNKYSSLANGTLTGLATIYKTYCCTCLSNQINALEILSMQITIKLTELE